MELLVPGWNLVHPIDDDHVKRDVSGLHKLEPELLLERHKNVREAAALSVTWTWHATRRAIGRRHTSAAGEATLAGKLKREIVFAA